MKKFLMERVGGLFLLIFAALIMVVFSSGRSVESSGIDELSFESYEADNHEISGEAIDKIDEVIISSDQAANINMLPSVIEREVEVDETVVQEVLRTEAEAQKKAEAEKYAELNDNLKKYCDKKYNSKKCKKYLSEAKTLAKTSKEYKKIYEKYLEKKEDRDEDSNDSKNTQIISDEKALTLDFVVKSPSGDRKFEIQFAQGETVYSVMKRAKEQGNISFEKNTDETYGVYINTINDLREGSEADWTENKYWILYVSGKSSSLGCSNHKLEKSDSSIEWRYEKYSF